MFRIIFTRLFSLLFALSLAGILELGAQIPEHKVPAFKARAIEYFNNEAYAAAESDFLKLIAQFPMDPMYRYYAGICKVGLNRDLNQAVELLHFASSRGVPPDVFYYLGEAHRKLYDFERARKSFVEFDRAASRKMAREKNTKLLISSVVYAMQVTSSYNPFDVESVTFMDLNDPDQYSQIKMKGGHLTVKPDELFSLNEERDDLNCLMFMPEKVGRGDLVFFSGLDRSGKNGFQIMQAKNSATGKWVDIKSVDVLNTDQDEILPYYDPVGRDIYFATNGREGIGGFDLFRSHFDESRGEWSEPINLGFPVNSAFDDYLLLPGSDLGKVIFFSARQSSDSAVAVYSVHLSEPKQTLTSRTPEEIRKIANLGNVAADARRDYEAYRTLFDGNGGSPELSGEGAGEAAETVEPEIQDDMDEGAGEVHDQQYDQLVFNALRHQSASDSLVELAMDARLKVRDSDDPNDRWIYQKQIMVWEKRADEERAVADGFFALVNEYVSGEMPAAIELDTVINDMTVYRFVEQPDRINEKAKEVFNDRPADMENSGNEKDAEPGAAEEKSSDRAEKLLPAERSSDPPVTEAVEDERSDPPVNEVVEDMRGDPPGLNSFEILDRSPYSANTPVPANMAIPGGTFYRIQLGVFSKKVAYDAFGGLTPVTAETLPERNLTKYYVGSFSRYEDVSRALPKVRAAGFADAFIVAYYNGRSMSLEKARNLEEPLP
ncbi:MAG: SPOR domain-containing protein [Bacteroidales bacterium]